MNSTFKDKSPQTSTLETNEPNLAGSIAMGSWSGGRFMHYGQAMSDEEYFTLFQTAWESGVRTFITADVYGNGEGDRLLGAALAGIPRSEYRLIGMLGHDFIEGKRTGNRGYPRFTDPALREESNYHSYLEGALSSSLARLNTGYFDALLLHNPDEIGYTNPIVWNTLNRFKEEGLIHAIGVAPGPANGFVLDLIQLFRTHGHIIDYCMAILNPLEPWPVKFILEECEAQGIEVITRVADYGGALFGHMADDHHFAPGDHRAYRPEGWVAAANAKAQQFSHIAERHGMTMIQLATSWALAQKAVSIITQTFVKEHGEDLAQVLERVREVAHTPVTPLSLEECEEIERIGDNTGCMPMKGASKRHVDGERPDEWAMRPRLELIAREIEWNMNW